MARPILDIEKILATQRVAALALIPRVANGVWKRAVDGAEDVLGEPGESDWLEWPVCVFELRHRRVRGMQDAGGLQARAEQEFLVAAPESGAVAGWSPAIGDLLVVDGVSWRVTVLARQAVDGGEDYWRAEGVRV